MRYPTCSRPSMGGARDLDAAVAQGPLVALERLAPRFAFGGIPGYLGGDLAQGLRPLVAQQHEHQVRQPLEPVHHRRQRRRPHHAPRSGGATVTGPYAFHLHLGAWLAIAALGVIYGVVVRRAPDASRAGGRGRERSRHGDSGGASAAVC